MKNELTDAWIQAGYKTFALLGPSALKIEVLARDVNKSKSSFYHHFVDIEIFIEELLEHHLRQSAIIAELERECKSIDPELLEIILANKLDLLFSRQLRVHRNIKKYKDCLDKSNQIVGEAILPIWSQSLGLSGNSDLSAMVLRLSLENFYLQITEETLNLDWLKSYFSDLKEMVDGLKGHSIPQT